VTVSFPASVGWFTDANRQLSQIGHAQSGRREAARIAYCIVSDSLAACAWMVRPATGEMTMMLENRVAGIFLGIFFAIFVAPALAHDPSHPEFNDWFNRLSSKRGGLCCSFADGLTVADPDWDSKNGHYRVRLEGNWIDVPDDAVITEPNKAGRTMVWPMRFDSEISIRCFIPGSMS